MAKLGRPIKKDSEKKIKYGISIEKHLFDRLKKEETSVSKFIQKLIQEYYEKKKI